MIGIVQTILNKLALDEWTIQIRGGDNSMFVLSSFNCNYNLTLRVNTDKHEASLQASNCLQDTFIELKGIPYTISRADKIDQVIKSAHRDGNRIAIACTAYAAAIRGQQV